MTRWIGIAAGAAALALLTSASATAAATVKPQGTKQQRLAPSVTDVGAQRRYRRHAVRPYSYGRPYQRYYYARPTYYRPYPYAVPAPFVFGFGFGPYW